MSTFHNNSKIKNRINQYLPFIKKSILLIKRENKSHFIGSYLSFLQAHILLCYFKLSKKKIVGICLIEHIGDIIANEPISRYARQKHPHSKIIWFVRGQYVNLLKHNPSIDKIIPIYCLTSWILLKRKHKFEMLYELHFQGRVCPVCLVPLLKENFNTEINGSNYYNFGGLLKATCINNNLEIIDEAPKLYIPNSTIISLAKKTKIKNCIVIHCHSNEKIRDWKTNKWEILVNELIKKFRLPVVEIGLKSNLNIIDSLYYNYCGKFSLLETAALIRNSKLFCGIDSAPAHMANSLEIPGIILLGEYYGMKNYNSYSGNYGKNIKCRLVYGKLHVEDIEVNDVFENIKSLSKEINL